MSARETATCIFRPATAADLPDVAAFLSNCGLPAQDLTPEIIAGFELAIATDGGLVGQIGLETFGDIGLLRSLAVAPAWRKHGLGAQLVARREAAARAAGLSAVYLLTSSATEFFRHRGYTEVPRETVPAAIAGHAQFTGLCPSCAHCLVRQLA